MQRFILMIGQVADDDTLQVQYTAVPSWLNKYYGQQLPEVEQRVRTVVPFDFANEDQSINSESQLDIHGSKSFRITSQSAANSNFGQSLDLNISGYLTPELRVRGAVSDRGYEPSYGTANSRLNELDKIYLELASDVFHAEIGDILLKDTYALQFDRSKKVSGIKIGLTYEHLSVSAAAARPKGIYTTATVTAIDGQQGPYQISNNNSIEPIVPGSETVWLDGEKLERGANNDYIIDYPLGRITFSVKNLIDTRSRIEIDFEPQSTTYKKEYLQAESNFSFADSSIDLHVGWLREGDDKEENLSSLFSEDDEEFLANVTDNDVKVYRSGIKPDSAGAYLLVSDSLPDSVFQYVGVPAGDYSILFSFVGNFQGAYRYIGSERYEYVGDGNGEYLPVRILNRPQRTDYLLSSLRFSDAGIGALTLHMQQSRFNQNLYAVNDKALVTGSFLQLDYTNLNKKNKNGVRFTAQLTEDTFQKRGRILKSDFSYKFLFPENRLFSTSERFVEVTARTTPLRKLSISPSYSTIQYKNRFSSHRVGIELQSDLSKKIQMNNSYFVTSSSLDTTFQSNGDASLFVSSVTYKIRQATSVTTQVEFSKREHTYQFDPRGTAFTRVKWQAGSKANFVNYEYYAEDSLSGDWSQNIKRQRFGVNTENRYNQFSYKALVQFQILNKSTINEKTFLNRVHLTYNDQKRNVTIGTSYSLSKETRNSRGLAYIEVETGEGDFLFEDSQYVADPNGNFIVVEEILSEDARVNRSEKTFTFKKKYQDVLLSFSSNIEEELFVEEKRSLAWLIPFYSDPEKAYLFYRRDYNAFLKAFPLISGYLFNFQFTQFQQSRFISNGNRSKKDREYNISSQQVFGDIFLEQGIDLFDNQRDSYYAGSGDVSGFELFNKVIKRFKANSLTAEIRYRRARSDDNSQAEIYSGIIRSHIRLFAKGELRTETEYYESKNFDDNATFYLLTGNHPGNRGVIWSSTLRYSLQKDFRLNIHINGRHADTRSARIYVRGEFVAGF